MSTSPRTHRLVFDPVAAFAWICAAIPLAFAVAKVLHLPWRASVLGALAVATLVAIPLVRRATRAPRPGGAGTGVCVLVVVAVLRALPLVGAIAPPGGDMSMHTWLARVALENHVLPSEQLPSYPGVPYGGYPLGLHAMVATLAPGPDDAAAAASVVIVIVHVLFAAAVFTLARGWTSPGVAALATLATVFVLRNPQGYVGWGGHPCVLGFAFAGLAVAWFHETLARGGGVAIATTTVFAAATVATHPTAAVVLAVALGGQALVAVVRRRDRRGLAWIGAVALGTTLLSAPVLLELGRVEFSARERAWVLEHHLLPPQSPPPSLALLPDYWKYVFGDAALAWASIGLLLAIARGRARSAAKVLAVLVLVPFAVVAHRHSASPLALVAYPERVLLVLVVPWAWCFAMVVESAREGWRGGWGRRGLATALVLGLTVTSVVNARVYYSLPARKAQRVTPLDLRAFDAIAARAASARVVSGDLPVVDHRVGDAAAFLPALRGVPTTNIQWNPVWLDELDRWRAEHPATMSIVRARSPLDRLLVAGDDEHRLLVGRFQDRGDTLWIWQGTPGALLLHPTRPDR